MNDGTMIMPFGKHKGKTIEELPSSYLSWMVENFDEEHLLDAADAELRFRDKHDTHIKG